MKTTSEIPGALAQFINRPALISEPHLARLAAQVRDRQAQFARFAEDQKDEPSEMEEWLSGWIPPVAKYEVKNGVAFIPVHGAITRGCSEIERLWFGFCDIDQVAANFRRAANDSSVHTVVADFNTPGGGIAQIPETAAFIAAMDKPVIAFTDELCASAGMWLACGCQAIVATPSAELGSIGVYAAVYDWSQFFADYGVKVEVFKSGKYKGAGLPGTSLSDEQRAMIQDSVEETFGLFKAAVRTGRGAVSDAAMQGQCFSAENAQHLNLCDEITPSRDQFLKAIHS